MDELTGKLSRITLLLMDCDGVLTDGRLYYSDKGETLKVFDVKDGQGISLWHAAGFQSGIITGRPGNGMVERRAAELGMNFVRDASTDKVADLRSIRELSGSSAESAAFIADDIGDLAVMRSVAFSFAVADAMEIVKDQATHVLSRNGGRGAVREAIDLILAAKALTDQ
jgi:3-deoxy-D-manno-octulosonate 8-phosphate phosphatase (KDO 8-P phosphatase)